MLSDVQVLRHRVSRLPICTVAVDVKRCASVEAQSLTLTNLYGSHSCYSDVQVLRHRVSRLPICTVAVDVKRCASVEAQSLTLTNMYGSHSCYSDVQVLRYSVSRLPICTVATAVIAMCKFCGTFQTITPLLHCTYTGHTQKNGEVSKVNTYGLKHSRLRNTFHTVIFGMPNAHLPVATDLRGLRGIASRTL
jgi:hypothetical protein